MKSFIEKHKPESYKEIPQPVDKVIEAIKNKENILIYGLTGTCKTAAIYSIAKEFDLEVIEINASDFRTRDQIEKTIGEASKQQSLFKKEKILLIEEADCLAGREDRGGAQGILDVLENSSFPVIITCNNPNNEKLKEIKKKTISVEFKPVNVSSVIKILKKICIKESIRFTEESLLKIAVNSKGDLRAAINDLQSSTVEKELKILDEKREYNLELVHILNQVLKTKDFEVHKILENIDLDDYMLWLDENLPLQYSGSDLINAYEIISKADIFKGRIRRWQYWRLMYYQLLLLSSGVSVIKEKTNNSFVSLKRSTRPLRIWQYNMKNAKKNSIAGKMAEATHTSKKEAVRNFSHYKYILKNKEIAEQLRLDEEEIEFIKSY